MKRWKCSMVAGIFGAMAPAWATEPPMTPAREREARSQEEARAQEQRRLGQEAAKALAAYHAWEVQSRAMLTQARSRQEQELRAPIERALEIFERERALPKGAAKFEPLSDRSAAAWVEGSDSVDLAAELGRRLADKLAWLQTTQALPALPSPAGVEDPMLMPAQMLLAIDPQLRPARIDVHAELKARRMPEGERLFESARQAMEALEAVSADGLRVMGPWSLQRPVISDPWTIFGEAGYQKSTQATRNMSQPAKELP